MYGNSAFTDDILEIFKPFIDEFELTPESHYPYTLLKGKNCILSFNLDRGETGCAFKQIKSDRLNSGYQVSFVYRCLYPDDILPERSIDDYYNPKLQLKDNFDMIESRLKNTFNGDFSWLDNYLKQTEKDNQICFFAKSLNKDHSIQKKISSGDNSWKKDAENLVAQNNIKLSDYKWPTDNFNF